MSNRTIKGAGSRVCFMPNRRCRAHILHPHSAVDLSFYEARTTPLSLSTFCRSPSAITELGTQALGILKIDEPRRRMLHRARPLHSDNRELRTPTRYARQERERPPNLQRQTVSLGYERRICRRSQSSEGAAMACRWSRPRFCLDGVSTNVPSTRAHC